ncbi:MAG: hypothetical protein PHR00_00685 [Patescibacteria group bacterium]|nr:hypothetical protein [Patescibacteria group bacterium]
MNKLEQPKSPENKESHNERLSKITEKISQEINSFAKEKIVGSDGALKMDRFSQINGGHLSKDDLTKHRENIKNREVEWSGVENPVVLENLKKEFNLYGLKGDDLKGKAIEKWRKKKENSKPVQLERAVNVLFYKMLKEKYLVVRSSKHDDYTNGVDNLLINKETGETVCAFDEVRGEQKHGRLEDKDHKIVAKAEAGGSNIDYGLGFESNEQGEKKLVKKSLTGLPMFYLSLSSEQLDDLLKNVDDNLDNKTDKENEYFKLFVTEMTEQADKLLSHDLKNKELKAKIQSFRHEFSELIA